jgi:histidinol dehydrogenase
MRVHALDSGEVARRGLAGTASYVRGLVPDAASVAERVGEIVAAVREQGDAALARLTRELDTGGAEPPALLVTADELDAALLSTPRELVASLQAAIANVAVVADAGVPLPALAELPQGHRVNLREVPVGAAAVYVPGGRAPYPSTVVMGVVTARSAGVLDVAVCSPPGVGGEVHPAILATCRLCGVERVYRMGGAQAIAALAYGTQTVDPVDVIVGPGNLYVQEAKRQVSRAVGIDGFAGPSDLLVVLGQGCGERDLRLAALDLLAQAEHGDGTLVVAVSPDAALLDTLGAHVETLEKERPTVGGAIAALVEVASDREAIAFANAFAPEHLELIGAEVEALAGSVTAAGCLFVGADSATAFGDYVAGSNHVLPTDGAARFSSMLSPRHFRRRLAEVRITAAAVPRLAAAGVPIARAEGFAVHAESMEARLRENPDP